MMNKLVQKFGRIVVAPQSFLLTIVTISTNLEPSLIGGFLLSKLLKCLKFGALGRTRTGTPHSWKLRILRPIVKKVKYLISLNNFNIDKPFGRIAVAPYSTIVTIITVIYDFKTVLKTSNPGGCLK